MYLLIGYENDPCCQIVSDLLRKRGHTVYIMAEPLAGDAVFCWTFDTTNSESSLRWKDGQLIYTPLTSSTRYPVVTTEQWAELARLMEHLTVALVEPYQGAVCYASIVGQRVIWNIDPDLSTAQRKSIDAGLCQLAQVLHTDLLQVEMLVGTEGPRCIGVHLFPEFTVHNTEEQWVLGEEIVTLLAGNYEMEEQT